MKVFAKSLPYVAVLTALTLLPGCIRYRPANTPVNHEATPAAKWLGRWTGPEGIYMDIDVQDAGYSVTISNLDAERSFHAMPNARGLAFERDGERERIRATDGPGTGMKWLTDKTDCLVVHPGEGYCRD